MTVVIGIDPGVRGALCVVNADAPEVLEWYDTPTIEVPGPKRRARNGDGQVATVQHRYNKAEMARILAGASLKYQVRLVVIEAPTPMPRFRRRRGGSGAVEGGADEARGSNPFTVEGGADEARGSNPFTDFGLGRSLGLWEGICAALGLRVETPAPITWKSKMVPRVAVAPGLTPGARKRLLKEAARARAIEVFPRFAEHLSLKKHEGRAEAALLAEYARRLP